MSVTTGLDVLLTNVAKELAGQRIAVLCNQASVASDLEHILDHLLKHDVKITRVFGPQHGIWGHTQDNMIEWEGYRDPRTNINFVSLYGEHREPTEEMLQGIDRLFIDLQDVGARYYTFIWTMALSMKACAKQHIPVTVLDRPNPINGSTTEGPMLQEGFASFVGLHPVPIRHGLTIGELATLFKRQHYPDCDLTVIHMKNWDRKMFFDQTGLPWVPPSPNMPTLETAIVYPGQCLLEGTNLSEGRGTTRPFESCGAPWIDAWKLADELAKYDLPGVLFRPVQFQPTFQKYSGEVCQGVFLHVTDRNSFQPVKTTVVLLGAVKKHWPDRFKWRSPPYEYETLREPIDILFGSQQLRRFIENSASYEEVSQWLSESSQECSDSSYRIYN